MFSISFWLTYRIEVPVNWDDNAFLLINSADRKNHSVNTIYNHSKVPYYLTGSVSG